MPADTRYPNGQRHIRLPNLPPAIRSYYQNQQFGAAATHDTGTSPGHIQQAAGAVHAAAHMAASYDRSWQR